MKQRVHPLLCGLFLSAMVLFLSAMVLSLAASPACAEDHDKRMVFYLNSYHNGYAWSDRILAGVRDVLGSSEMTIELQIEYLDTKKYEYDHVAPELVEIFRHKYAEEHFDIIMVSDNNALSFILDYGEELFPGVPIVFCGINDFDMARLEGKAATGVVESINARSTFDLALKLHPEAHDVWVIGDESSTGIGIRSQIESVVPFFAGRLFFNFITHDELAGILDQNGRVPEDTLLYFIPIYRNIKGTYYTAEELLEIIHSSSNAPCYSNWEFLLGHGVVGGNLISGFTHGQAMARTALRVLGGDDPRDIPIDTEIRDQNIFDWLVLKEQKVDLDLLPKDSLFINAPEPFYQLGKQVVWTFLVMLAMLLVILVILASNIVRRRAVEKTIKEQLDFRELLLDTIPLYICWKDLDQNYLGVNRSFVNFYGLGDEESLKNLQESEITLENDSLVEAELLDRQVITSRMPIRKHKMTATARDGSPVWLQITKVPLFDHAGNVVGTLTMGENVTREVSLEQQLLQSQKMEAIGTLAGGLAHDFNNILTSIINSTELARMDMEEESPMYSDLERVLRAADRGASLVKRILSFSRPSTEGFINTNISETLTEALNLVERSLPRNIVIQRDIVALDSVVFADPGQIHQVVMNLCTNAYQSLRGRGGIIRATLRETDLDHDQAGALNLPHGQYLRLSIMDNGPGIPKEISDKVFDPFFTTKPSTEGTGLGLAVVLGIVKNHRGAIRLTSVPEVETRLEIFLPLYASETSSADHGEKTIRPGHEHILFVEDDEDQLATTPRLLESLGYRVTARNSADQAMQLLNSQAETGTEFDLIITDFDMPGLNGLELATRTRELLPDIPVILVSGRKSSLEKADTHPCVCTVVMKPYNKYSLSEAIRNALDQIERRPS